MNNHISLGFAESEVLRFIIDNISRCSSKTISRKNLYEVSFFF